MVSGVSEDPLRPPCILYGLRNSALNEQKITQAFLKNLYFSENLRSWQLVPQRNNCYWRILMILLQQLHKPVLTIYKELKVISLKIWIILIFIGHFLQARSCVESSPHSSSSFNPGSYHVLPRSLLRELKLRGRRLPTVTQLAGGSQT